jgi:hypothetical protein
VVLVFKFGYVIDIAYNLLFYDYGDYPSLKFREIDIILNIGNEGARWKNSSLTSQHCRDALHFVPL